MEIARFDPAADADSLTACYDMFVAGLDADDPGAPPLGREDFAGWWAGAYSGNPCQSFLATDSSGPVGGCLLDFPNRANLHTVSFAVVVPPAARRRGVGSALLARGIAETRRAGRSELTGMTLEQSPGAHFAQAVGAASGLGDVRRVLDLADCPPDRRSALRAAAAPLAAGYDLTSWCGATPERYLAESAAMSEAMADAPRNPGTEAERWDADRLRNAEQAGLDRGIDFYSIAAIHAGTGEMAALTQVAVDVAGAPGWADQLITAVHRPHRGHRLGMLVKVAMLDLLSAQAPGLRRITTSNAELNEHMVAINEQLGFRATGRFLTWELDLGAA